MMGKHTCTLCEIAFAGEDFRIVYKKGPKTLMVVSAKPRATKTIQWKALKALARDAFRRYGISFRFVRGPGHHWHVIAEPV